MNRSWQAAFLSVLILVPCLLASIPAPAAERDAQVRAIWVTRWDYKSPADVRRIIANCAETRFNVILLQVRGNGTVFYPSKIEPWAWELASEGPEANTPPKLAQIAKHIGVKLNTFRSNYLPEMKRRGVQKINGKWAFTSKV